MHTDPEPRDSAPRSAIQLENAAIPAALSPAGGAATPPSVAGWRALFAGGSRARSAVWLALGWGCGWLASVALSMGPQGGTDAILGADLALGCAVAALAGITVYARMQRVT